MEWNVFYHNWNANELKRFNILREHGSFAENVKKCKKKYKNDKEEFAKRLKSELMYAFWSKSEWEVIITKKDTRIIMTPWCGRREKIELDVTDDENFDWLGFYDWMKDKHYADKNGSIKIDVYSQVMYRFDEFVDYCWE